ncbi:MAG TPA: alpha/beta fold hydrolase [Allosphingosinicella sp.]|nr:alpha/beta fold hydrolase [Allosphingosinicella sp.]
MRLRRLLFLAALLPILLCAAAWDVGTILGHPRNGPVPAPAPPGVVVRLTASDGVPIAGAYWPGRRPDGPAVLLLHGINNDRDRLRAQALWLHGLGYAVLAIDFRGHGESGAAERTYGWHEARDAAAALGFLRDGKPERKVGLVGISLGGAAALLGDGGPLPVEAMVLHAVYPDLRTAIANRLARIGSRAVAGLFEPLLSEQAWLRYGVSPDRIAPAAAIRAYRGRLLVIGGTADRDTRPEDTRALYDAAPGPKQLWLVEGADHLATSILWNDAWRSRVRALFAASLGEP